MKRRDFILNSALGALSTTAIVPAYSFEDKILPCIRFGIIADLHQDFIPDAPRRLQAFIDDMKIKKPDFIIQMGDFCWPIAKNEIIMKIWSEFKGPKYHVIGNHDLKGEAGKIFPRENLEQFWGLKAPYYSFDIKGFHFIVLDGNEVNPADKDLHYPRYVGEKQLQWLQDDLDQTTLPVMVFIHQGLVYDGGIQNQTSVMQYFHRANAKAGYTKVKAVFTGHQHMDYYNHINSVHYIQINSASYHWQGDHYVQTPYDEKVIKEYPWVKKEATYKDPLWALIDIKSDGTLIMHGKRSVFLGKTPVQLGMPPYKYSYPVVPYISDRTLKLTGVIPTK